MTTPPLLLSSLLTLLVARCAAESCDRERFMAAPDKCTEMHLKRRQLGDVGAVELAKALKTNAFLIELDLENNDIGDDGARALAEALKTNTVLAELDLEDNDIGDDGAAALAEALKINTALHRLDLEGNSIGLDGAKALIEALKVNSALRRLDLNSKSLDDGFTKAVADVMKELGSQSLLERGRKLDMALLAAFELAAHRHGSFSAAAAAAAAAEAAELIEKTKALGLYDHFRIYLGREKTTSDILARAVRWCDVMGAKTARDLAHLPSQDLHPLVASLDLKMPARNQEKFVEKLAAAIFNAAKDEL